MHAHPPAPTRRDFLATTGRFGAASFLTGAGLAPVHVHGGDTLRVALVGCGGRGGGAAVNALSVPGDAFGRRPHA